MRTVFFRLGCLLIFFSFLAWITSSPGDLHHVTVQEFIFSLLVGLLFMSPELVHQYRLLTSSHARFHDW